tara:strand:+ start:215 stop:907 length:693 start_codon:yes stop_codon:yes gene_type:complete
VPFEEASSIDPSPLRIGFVTRSAWGPVHSDCVDAVEKTAALLEGLGHKVQSDSPVALFDDDLFEHFKIVMASNEAHSVAKLSEAIGRPFEPNDMEADTRALVEFGRRRTAADYLASVEWFNLYTRRMAEWWNEFDILLTPVIAEPPPKLGELRNPKLGTKRLREILLFTVQFNITGQPAISLPIHMNDNGLPVGVQLVGPMHGEISLLQLGNQLELAAPWHHRTPGVWAQ